MADGNVSDGTGRCVVCGDHSVLTVGGLYFCSFDHEFRYFDTGGDHDGA